MRPSTLLLLAAFPLLATAADARAEDRHPHAAAPPAVGADLPAGSTPAARACVEQAYGAVRVAPFTGSPAHVTRAFFVPR